MRTLMEYDLIDEYRLMVHPVVLGKGKRPFGHVGQTRDLRLVDTKQVGPDGVLILTYRPVEKEAEEHSSPSGREAGKRLLQRTNFLKSSFPPEYREEYRLASPQRAVQQVLFAPRTIPGAHRLLPITRPLA
jgi:hypothetical protein